MSGNPDLTPREQDILRLLTVGKTSRDIASDLNISVSTVKAHLSSIYAKLGVTNRTQAAIVGLQIFRPLAG
jgi:DNA-binding NarL/FixJ family response regulator